MSETSPSAERKPASAKPLLKPRDAATLIIVDSSSSEPRILFGKRRLDQKFMPGKYVFPGGRVDTCDRFATATDDLTSLDTEKLLVGMKGRVSQTRARALALAAIRETFEEAGLLIGEKVGADAALASLTSAGTRAGTWRDFLGHGVQPSLGQMKFFARAITPPGRPRRYDTRFFCIEASAIVHRIDDSDGELVELHWLSLDEARQGFDLPPITRVILEDLADRLSDGRLRQDDRPIPFYHHKNGIFRRDVL
ncbi:MAG: NUDIX domain-containing protein [Hyphomicrobiaceae bacterium]